MLARAIDAIDAGIFWPGEGGRFAPLMQALRHHDYYMVTADFDDYVAAQRRVDKLWLSSSDWAQVSMRNIAHMGWFSSDRAIGEYADEIWNVPVTTPAEARAEAAEQA
jgi:starch phosphorylase